MPSSLHWLDHDPGERERVQRILALFREKDSRDELGLGAIRDAIADLLFPGTSTIQTRLRYMLFVAWMYQRYEQDRVSSRDVAARGRNFELALIRPLLETDKRGAGVFGRMAGGRLQRLPSSVYWAGLGAWGIRRMPHSVDEYHRSLDQTYLRRRAQRRADDGELLHDATTATWHAKLPSPPPEFPLKADFELRPEDADFLSHCIVTSAPNSLLAWLVQHRKPADVRFPWEHPNVGDFTADHQALLHHARLVSETTHGAARLYNLLLARKKEDQALVETHGRELLAWVDTPIRGLHDWDLADLWRRLTLTNHVVAPATQLFVERWVRLVRAGLHDAKVMLEASDLVQQREMRLKSARSRFRNQRALDQWGGFAGLDRLAFRWDTASTFLADLHAGFAAKE
jgi:hypothetical protein